MQDAGAWWSVICPVGVSLSGIRHEQDRHDLTEIGFALYEQLRNVSGFRYAVVGVEVDGSWRFNELDAEVAAPSYSGLVISEELWRHLGSPENYVEFSPGFRWQPFVQVRG
jgi:hypothetical protein